MQSAPRAFVRSRAAAYEMERSRVDVADVDRARRRGAPVDERSARSGRGPGGSRSLGPSVRESTRTARDVSTRPRRFLSRACVSTPHAASKTIAVASPSASGERESISVVRRFRGHREGIARASSSLSSRRRTLFSHVAFFFAPSLACRTSRAFVPSKHPRGRALERPFLKNPPALFVAAGRARSSRRSTFRSTPAN
jgi:hypothetical protein